MSRFVEEEVGTFLARWSRRKVAARRGAPEPDPVLPSEAAIAPDADAETAPAAREAPLEERSGPEPPPLPDPDTLDAASDLRPFLQPGVPAELKRRALRRMWKVNPIIATPDGLDDYYVVNDFSDASTAVADLRTLYRVGRGMLASAEEEGTEAAVPAEERREIAHATPELPSTDPPLPPEPTSAPEPTTAAEPVVVEPVRVAGDGLQDG